MLMFVDNIIANKMVHYEMKYNMLHYFATCRCQRDGPIASWMISFYCLSCELVRC